MSTMSIQSQQNSSIHHTDMTTLENSHTTHISGLLTSRNEDYNHTDILRNGVSSQNVYTSGKVEVSYSDAKRVANYFTTHGDAKKWRLDGKIYTIPKSLNELIKSHGSEASGRIFAVTVYDAKTAKAAGVLESASEAVKSDFTSQFFVQYLSARQNLPEYGQMGRPALIQAIR
jgi:hypothetical protein